MCFRRSINTQLLHKENITKLSKTPFNKIVLSVSVQPLFTIEGRAWFTPFAVGGRVWFIPYAVG